MRSLVNQEARKEMRAALAGKSATKANINKVLKSIYEFVSVRFVPYNAPYGPTGRQTKVRKDHNGKIIKGFRTGVRYSPIDATSVKSQKVIDLLNEMKSDLIWLWGSDILEDDHPKFKSFIFEGRNGKKLRVVLHEVMYTADLNLSDEYQNSYINYTIVDA